MEVYIIEQNSTVCPLNHNVLKEINFFIIVVKSDPSENCFFLKWASAIIITADGYKK